MCDKWFQEYLDEDPWEWPGDDGPPDPYMAEVVNRSHTLFTKLLARSKDPEATIGIPIIHKRLKP
jgi:hypothetical protein